MPIETDFDPAFATTLAMREKQIQQNYRPLIGIHKWFARRPGTLFRSLLLAEYNGAEPMASAFWRAHELHGLIADPFMGGGTTVFEANRLGLSVIGSDINAMAHWIVRQALAPLDRAEFIAAADGVVDRVEQQIAGLYETQCLRCRQPARVKYFIWVKTETCPHCQTVNDLFPGYLLAEAVRHPRCVVACRSCGHLNEYDDVPTNDAPSRCAECRRRVSVEGPAHRQQVECRDCHKSFRFPQPHPVPHPPQHRLWAIEYHCDRCKPTQEGRFFKRPGPRDLARVAEASDRLRTAADLILPDDEIPAGDETNRLHRWAYRRYRDMFNDRQLLGLGLLLRELRAVESTACRHALLTVFSDILRYQNMLCRYDTYALKCQDIFSVHGFPVGLVQCENNLLGIPRVGSGAFRHFVEKYLRAKDYCAHPFETRIENGRKRIVPVEGERIEAAMSDSPPMNGAQRRAFLYAGPATEVDLAGVALDGVFTDPPYFDNVQYAELIDFCYVWLRLALRDNQPQFRPVSTRHADELTGNVTLARGLEAFTDGLSRVFTTYARPLKPGAPFVFTYHHNDPHAYAPIVVAILDAGLDCTSTLPAAGEMGASLHIAGTGSSVLDSVFVCRPYVAGTVRALEPTDLRRVVADDIKAMRAAGLRVAEGDLRCLLAGHVARLAVNTLRQSWDGAGVTAARFDQAKRTIAELVARFDTASMLTTMLPKGQAKGRTTRAQEKTVAASV